MLTYHIPFITLCKPDNFQYTQGLFLFSELLIKAGIKVDRSPNEGLWFDFGIKLTWPSEYYVALLVLPLSKIVMMITSHELNSKT